MDFVWRIAYKLYHSGKHSKLARFFEVISFVISSHAVSAQITLGNNSKFYHHGLGCTALQTVQIGESCIIFQNVTFGNAIIDTSGKLSDNSGGALHSWRQRYDWGRSSHSRKYQNWKQCFNWSECSSNSRYPRQLCSCRNTGKMA